MTDEQPCYRHPDRPYAVRCQRCERPICRECMVQASVGFHCPECVRSSGQPVQRGIVLRDPVMTWAIMAACVGVFAAQGFSYTADGIGSLEVTRRGILYGPDVADGELWRVFTSAFLHANLMHIGFNLFLLYQLGPILERGVGRVFMLLTYVGGALAGSLAVLAFNFQIPTLGASGAVLGLAAATVTVLHDRGISLRGTNLLGLILINLGLPIVVGGISFWGHLGGVAGGALLAFVQLRIGEGTAKSQAAALVVCAVLLGACAAVAARGGLV